MPKDPYKIVDTKPSWVSKLSSGAVALGSVATAVVITVPGLPGYDILTQLATGPEAQPTNSDSLGSGVADPNQPQEPVSAQAVSIVPASSNSSPASVGASAKQVPKPAAAKSGAPKSGATLALPGINSGNTSSPTPSGSGGSASNAGSNVGSGTSSGNTSSPTPSGGSSASGNSSYNGDDDYDGDDNYEGDEDSDEEDDD
ncbi:unannotated protein [freshwater metagenome]|uniref:Unannotated protein n=1 Tax=freshwater metagenome TaxID=449393 RepID=A0A6J6JQ21_9ZZZZ|nr:hypothetical protein [Actinomycetota bacterium]